jgi:hypothetical protein
MLMHLSKVRISIIDSLMERPVGVGAVTPKIAANTYENSNDEL